MAREVSVCRACGLQVPESGICPDCGPTQTTPLDDFAREQEKKRYKKDRIVIKMNRKKIK